LKGCSAIRQLEYRSNYQHRIWREPAKNKTETKIEISAVEGRERIRLTLKKFDAPSVPETPFINNLVKKYQANKRVKKILKEAIAA
jgi:hypothetical protein